MGADIFTQILRFIIHQWYKKTTCIILVILFNGGLLFSSTPNENTLSKELGEQFIQDKYLPNIYVDTNLQNHQELVFILNKKSYQKSIKSNILHLFSHGKVGQLYIENEWKNIEELAEWIRTKYDLSTIQHINIYGCEFAKGEIGKRAVAFLERELRVTIAASNDVTGFNGDWELEVGQSQEVLSAKEYAYNLQDCCRPDQPQGHLHPKRLKLKYVGSGTANIVFRFKDSGGPIHFSGNVASGESFIVDGSGMTNKHGQEGLETNTWYSVNGSSGSFHTSCSQNLDVGDIIDGLFEVLAIEMPLVSGFGGISCTEGTFCPDAGTNGTLSVCPNDLSTILLFNALGGNPTAGGSWSPSLNGAGTYTYSHPAANGCPMVSSQVVASSPTGTDTDSDGIPNVCDLDDDNDGILDTEEGICSGVATANLSPYNGSSSTTASIFNNNQIKIGDARITVNNTTTGSASISTDKISDLHYSNSPGLRLGHNGSADSPSDQIIITLNFSVPISDLKFNLYDVDAGDRITVKAYDQNNALINISSSNYTLSANTVVTFSNNRFSDVSSNDYGSNEPKTRVQLDFTGQTISRVVFEYFDINSGGSYTIAAFSGKSCLLSEDFDNDNIPNYLDPDSDNDGCPDALEGGANFTNADIDVNNRLIGGIDLNGVPAVAGSAGQSVGSSQNTSIASCGEICNDGIDNDGDGQIDCADSDCSINGTVNITQPSCPNLSSGSITVNATGSNLEYSMNGVNYQSSNVFTNQMAGNYTIVIRNTVTGCTKNIPVTINNPNCPEICNNGIDDNGDGFVDCADGNCQPNVTFVVNNETCSQTNGSIVLSFDDSPSETAIQFSINGGSTWAYTSPDNAGSYIIGGLAAGNYNLRVRWGSTACSEVVDNSIMITNDNTPANCQAKLLFQKSIGKDTVLMRATEFYTFTIVNNSNTILNNVTFTDALQNNAKFVSDVVNVIGGLQIVGTVDYQNTANLTLNNIPIGVSSFQLAVDIPGGLAPGSTFCNQATLTSLTIPNSPTSILSDDPSTPLIVGDPTCVILKLYENCCNGIDDDGDGLCDEDDPDCGN